MSAPLDELYLEWLYSQVSPVKNRNPARTYWSLLRQLYKTEFVWLIPNDDNRVEDGRDLRYEFVDQHDLDDVDPFWMNLGCSMLEMLIGLSRRLSFEAEGEARVWFWHLIETLGLLYNDKEFSPRHEKEVYRKLEDVIWRNYASDGRGGLFPLSNPTQDQREVEIWYQLCSYLVELM